MQLNTFLCLLSFSCLVIVAQTASIEAASRIIGGSYASPGQFPFQVAVLLDDEQICGGSIISENFVVTAAHCLYEFERRLPTKSFSIRAGSTSRSSGGTKVRISDAYIHEAYNVAEYGNDIALLKLSKPLTFSDSIKAIKLAREAPPNGASITISGWGFTTLYGPLSEKLKFIKNMMVYPETTQNKMLFLRNFENNGACSGDSGGPAVYENKLVGVFSLFPQYTKEYANIYTLVPSFYQWLYDNSDLRNSAQKL